MVTSRILAVQCLLDMEQGGFSNLVVKQRTRHKQISARDMQFFARLFYGTLERAVTLDFIVSRFVSKPLEKLDREVLAILRSGLYQCRYMDAVPVAAAVDESVKLCAVFKKRSAAGFVNAVLRKAAAFDVDAAVAQISDPTERLAVTYSVCGALAKMLTAQYGVECAAQMLEATLWQAPPVVRVNTWMTNRKALRDRLAGEGITAQDSILPAAVDITAGRYLESGALADGSMRLQSFAAQYAVCVLDPKPGETVLDMCAAPGGKTLTAAQHMDNRGRITALDVHESRVDLIRAQAEREGISIVDAVCADATVYRDDGQYDAVLCDVPCSGYGELAKKPELRRKAPTAETLVPVQRKILENAALHVKAGGRVVYATCTLDGRENEHIVDAFLSEHANFRANKPSWIPACASLSGQYVKFLPQAGANEGFFIATLERMW